MKLTVVAAFVIATLCGAAGIVLMPTRKRLFAITALITILAFATASPALGGFTADHPEHPRPAPPVTMTASTLGVPNLSCSWGGATTINLSFPHSSSWAQTQIDRSMNGDAYSELGTVSAGTTTGSDSAANSPTTNTYTYRAFSKLSNWTSSYSDVVSSATCSGAITTLGTGALPSQIGAPEDVDVDANGNIAIADNTRNRVEYIPATSGWYFGTAMTAGYVYSIAGTGTSGYDAAADTNAAPASSYRVNNPEAVAFDANGNVIFTDTMNDRIRIIFKQDCNSSCPFGAAATSAGRSRTIAGTGTNGYSGDGGAATSANLRAPRGLALDSAGNILISDTTNNRVRMVFKTTCTGASCGYGLPNDTYNANSIYTIVGDGTSAYLDATPATSGRISAAQAIAVDSSDNLYITDTGNNRVRKVLRSTGAMSLFAGNATSGTAGDDGPANDPGARLSASVQGIAVDLATDNVYIADTSSHRVRMVAQQGGAYPTTVHGVTFSASNEIDTVAGMGSAGPPNEGYPANDEVAGAASGSARLESPRGLAVVNGTIYIADSSNYSIRKVTPTNRMYTVAGNNTSGATFGVPGQTSGLVQPAGVAADSAGNVYIADAGDHRLRKYDAASGELWTIAGTGSAGATGDGALALAAKLSSPEGVAVDANGTVYIADTGNNRVRAVCPTGGSSCSALGVSISASNIGLLVNGTTVSGTCADGTSSTHTACKLNGPKALAVNSSGDIAVADSGNHKIMYFVNSGLFTRYGVLMGAGGGYTVAGTGAAGHNGDQTPATLMTLTTPTGVAFDADNNLIVADTGNQRIRKIAANGGAGTTIAGTGTAGDDGDGAAATAAKITSPKYPVVDGSTIYFISGGAYVRKFTEGGNISTIAGTGSNGFDGDRGPATSAQIMAVGVARGGSSGDIFLAGGTGSNTQVRKIYGPV